MTNNNINSSFSAWKIWLAVLIGLAFASFMLVSSLSEIHFVETKPGKGTHVWAGLNADNKVDLANEKDFKLFSNGNYRIKTNSEFISEIPWTSSTLLYLFLAIVCMFGRDIAYMWRIKTLTGDHLSWKSSFYVIMMWEFASALAPGVASGSTVAMFILNKEKISLGKSTAIVLITTMMDNLFYVIMIPFVFIFISSSALFPSENNANSSIELLFWSAYGIFFLLFLLLFVSVFFYPQFVKKILSSVFKLPFLKKWRLGAIKTGEDVEFSAIEFKKEKKSFWIKSFAATFISWTSRYLVINCILAAFISLTFNDHFFVFGKQFVLWLFMRVSPTPGGSGVAEYAFGELMTSFSDSTILLVALAIIWRLISYFPYLIIGAIILPRWMKKK